MQRNFEPMRKQVEAWQRSELTDVSAKVVNRHHLLPPRGRHRNSWASAEYRVGEFPGHDIRGRGAAREK